MTIQVLWEKQERMHTRFGFYFAENFVKFEYSGPFDMDTGEWIDARGSFRIADFAESLKKLESETYSEVKGAGGETLRLKTLPTGTIVLDFDGGPSNNILNIDLGIRSQDLFLTLPK